MKWILISKLRTMLTIQLLFPSVLIPSKPSRFKSDFIHKLVLTAISPDFQLNDEESLVTKEMVDMMGEMMSNIN